jgi:hypothetical protein
LLGLFDPEEGDMFPETTVDFQCTIWRYFQRKLLFVTTAENLKSYRDRVYVNNIRYVPGRPTYQTDALGKTLYTASSNGRETTNA